MRCWLSFRKGFLAVLLIGAVGCTGHQENRGVSQGNDPPVKPTGSQRADNTGTSSPAKAGDYKVRFKTSKGDFVVLVHSDWAPRGADRFRTLVENNFYDGCRFFRVVPDFMVQFGINGNPKIQSLWRDRNIPDDPRVQSNTKGRITFATSGPHSRTSQVFINYKNNSFLDDQGFSPFGEVIEGMAIVESINPEYREQPDQGAIQSQGNDYLKREFPNLDYIESATIIE